MGPAAHAALVRCLRARYVSLTSTPACFVTAGTDAPALAAHRPPPIHVLDPACAAGLVELDLTGCTPVCLSSRLLSVSPHVYCPVSPHMSLPCRSRLLPCIPSCLLPCLPSSWVQGSCIPHSLPLSPCLGSVGGRVPVLVQARAPMCQALAPRCHLYPPVVACISRF